MTSATPTTSETPVYGVESLGAGNPVYDQIVSMDKADAIHSFDNLSGEIHASTKSALWKTAVTQEIVSSTT